MLRKPLLALLSLGGAVACFFPKGTPETVALGDTTVLSELTPADATLLERYLRSSPRWDVSENRSGRYAFRRERPSGWSAVPAEGAPTPDPEFGIPGGYEGGSNGFHSDFSSTDVVQTRVLLDFGGEYGFGDRSPARAKAGDPSASVRVSKNSDQPGLDSYLVVEGASGVKLEVFEQSHERKRVFTERAVREVSEELRAVLASREEIEKNGFAADLMKEMPLKRGTPRMQVTDGMQPGMYGVTAWINPGSDGRVYLRVFYEGPDPAVGMKGVPQQEITHVGQELSRDRIRPGTVRFVGWGADPAVLFPYETGVMVYEGGWNDAYRARFELWLDDPAGKQHLLLTESRTIAGWER